MKDGPNASIGRSTYRKWARSKLLKAQALMTFSKKFEFRWCPSNLFDAHRSDLEKDKLDWLSASFQTFSARFSFLSEMSVANEFTDVAWIQTDDRIFVQVDYFLLKLWTVSSNYFLLILFVTFRKALKLT